MKPKDIEKSLSNVRSSRELLEQIRSDVDQQIETLNAAEMSLLYAARQPARERRSGKGQGSGANNVFANVQTAKVASKKTAA